MGSDRRPDADLRTPSPGTLAGLVLAVIAGLFVALGLSRPIVHHPDRVRPLSKGDRTGCHPGSGCPT